MPHNPLSFQQIVETLGEAICVVDRDQRIAFYNAKAARWLGYEVRQEVGRSVLDSVFPEDVPMMRTRLERRGAGESERYPQRFRRSDGSAVWGLVSTRAVLDDAGRFAGSLIVIADISDLKGADEALRRSEFWLRQSQRIARLGSYVFDIVANRWQSSEYLDELFGISPDSGRTADDWLAIVHPDDRASMSAYLAEEVIGRRRPFNLEYRILRPADGDVRWVQGLGELEFDGSGTPIRLFGTIQDVTARHEQDVERRRLETQLLQTQKLESLGVLAGGIAHDFNNLLTSILGNADLALQDLPPGSPVRENILAIESSSRRAAEISQQMLAYSGRGRFVVGPLMLSHLVRDMMRMLELAASRRTLLQVELGDDLPPIEGDAGQLRQVVLNLVANASEAVGERDGAIGIATSAVQCDQLHPCVDYFGDPLRSGQYVLLEVSDSGVGMSAETLARVFDPFFTTKFTGRGLGLPAVLGIVRGHRGSIQIDSQPERGTTFRVFLPALAPVPAHRETPSAAVTPPANTPVVLVVDDEDGVRTMAERMVQRCGYRAVGASDGLEALRLIREDPGRFSCVLLDLTMPKLGGEEALREIHKVASDLPVVLCSGYHSQELSERFAGQGLSGFIQKPYRLADIKVTLQAVIP